MRLPPPPGHFTYPALRVALVFAAGISAGESLPISAAAWALLATSSLVPLIGSRCIRAGGPASPAVTSLAVALLFALGALKVQLDRPSSVVGAPRDITLIGTVTDPPSQWQRRIRFTLQSARCVERGHPLPLALRLAVTVVRTASDTLERPLRYGMTLALKGTLAPSPPEHNPGEFSLRRYHDANGIDGVFYLRGVTNLAVLDSSGGSVIMRRLILPFRATLIRHIDRTVGGEEGEFLKALMIGEKEGIPDQAREEFIDSGVAHILAVSGSRVLVVMGVLLFLYNLLRLPVIVRAPAVVAGLLFYMILTGSHPPAVRATVMAALFLLGRAVRRQASPRNSLGLSALVILCFDARQLFDAGFQLSFGAALSLAHFYPIASAWIAGLAGKGIRHALFRWVLRTSALSLIATLGVIPVSAACFGRVSLIGVLTNIIVIPAAGLSVVLASASLCVAVVCPFAERAFAAVNAQVLHMTLLTASYAASVPFSSIATLRFSALDALPFYAALGLLFHWPNRTAAKRLFVALLAGLNLVLYAPHDAAGGDRSSLSLSVIDVGQGDALLVEFPGGRTMLVDGGPGTPGRDAGEAVVSPFLRRRGVSRIDLLVVSHADDDHMGGVPYLIRHFRIGRVIDNGRPVRSALYAEYRRAIAETGCPVTAVRAGMTVDGAPDARIYVLWPEGPAGDTLRPPQNLNNTSVVFKLVYGEVSFLFTGDAERGAESRMICMYGGFLRSTLLKVGHHGSASSSSQDFLEAVRPSLAAVSVGLHNRFGHPSPVVIRGLEELHTAVLRTDREGAVMLATDGRTLWQVLWR